MSPLKIFHHAHAFASRRFNQIVTAGALSLLTATTAFGQIQHPNLERGFQAEKAYNFSQVDDVNLFNGNLLVKIPIGGEFHVGETLSYRLTLVHNGKAWDWSIFRGSSVAAKAIPAWDSNAGWGWQLHFGKIIARSIGERNSSGNLIYVSPDGGEHVFEGNAQPNYTKDSSFLRLKETGSTAIIEFPNGNKHTFVRYGNAQEYVLTRMEDTYGNWMAVSYSSSQWAITDSVGRSHIIELEQKNLDGRTVFFPRYVRLAAFNGSVAVHTLDYTDAVVQRPMPHDPVGTNIPINVTLPLLTQVNLPDGTTWELPTSYYMTTRGPGGISGHLLKLRLPTRGILAWDYAIWRFPTDRVTGPQGAENAPFLESTPGVSVRKTLSPGGTETARWTYDSYWAHPNLWPQIRPVTKTTTVVDPLGHKTVHYFGIYDGYLTPVAAAARGDQYGLPFSVEQVDGTRYISKHFFKSGQTVANRTDWVRYENDGPGNYQNNRRIVSTKTEWDGRFKTVDLSDYDGVGNYRFRSMNGNYRDDSPTFNWRNEYTGYNPSGPPSASAPWILKTYNVQWEEEAWGRSEREFFFDKGRVRFERRLATKVPGGGRSGEDTLVFLDRDAAGNVIKEEYYGGYFNTIGTSALSYNYARPASPAVALDMTYQYGQLATRKYRGASFFVVDQTIDLNTGLASSTRDQAGIQTTYLYDAMGRETWSRPASGHDAWTQRVYNNASGNSGPWVAIYDRPNNSTTSLIREIEFLFDAFGRLKRERKNIPTAGWIQRDRAYDGAGNQIGITEWQGGSSPGFWTSYENFDPFGRPGRTVRPDGKIVTTTHWGDWGLNQRWTYGQSYNNGVVNEATAGFDLDYDMMGRVTRAQEIEGGALANLDNRYYYTPQGLLFQATSTPRSGNPQNRYNDYDGRGFKVSETTPEAGTFVMSKYDAVGQANRRQHVASGLDLGFTFDSFERLVGVRDNNLNIDLKTWTYGDATAGSYGAYKNGKVVKSVHFNRVRVPWGSATTWISLPVEETMVYDGRGGRPSSRTTNLNNNYQFSQTWSYDDLGNLISETYPRCSGGQCMAAVANPRLQGYTYDRGFLTNVAGFATISYHDNAAVSRTVAPSGLNIYFDKDPSQIPRIYNIRASGGILLPSEEGRHIYDGVGNLVQLSRNSGTATFEDAVSQAKASVGEPSDDLGEPVNNLQAVYQTYFLYDAFGRLRVHNDVSGRRRDYDFNAFGGLTKIWNRDNSTYREFAVSTATNRLTSLVTYDQRGNLLTRGLGAGSTEVYEWNAFDQLASINFPGVTHLYTASGERVWTLKYTPSTGATEDLFTLRGLGNQTLTVYKHTSQGTNETWSWEEDYVYRKGYLLGKVTRQAVPRTKIYFVCDRLGTPRMALEPNGFAFESFSYSSFGDQWHGSNSTERMRFTGHERDFGNSGKADDLDYMHARYYSHDVGRFLTPDPALSAQLTAPQTWNRYSYANNNPANFVDPDGRWAHVAVGALVGGLVNVAAKVIDGKAEGYEPTDGDLVKAFLIGAADGALTAGTFGANRVVAAGVSVTAGIADRALDSTDKTEALDPASVLADGAGGLVGHAVGNLIEASAKATVKYAGPRLVAAAGRAAKGSYGGSVSKKHFETVIKNSTGLGQKTKEALVSETANWATAVVTQPAAEAVVPASDNQPPVVR